LAEVGAQHLRVAQHLLPVLVLHPGVVVDADSAELFDAVRLLGGDGRDGLFHRSYMRPAGARLKSGWKTAKPRPNAQLVCTCLTANCESARQYSAFASRRRRLARRRSS